MSRSPSFHGSHYGDSQGDIFSPGGRRYSAYVPWEGLSRWSQVQKDLVHRVVGRWGKLQLQAGWNSWFNVVKEKQRAQL